MNPTLDYATGKKRGHTIAFIGKIINLELCAQHKTHLLTQYSSELFLGILRKGRAKNFSHVATGDILRIHPVITFVLLLLSSHTTLSFDDLGPETSQKGRNLFCLYSASLRFLHIIIK